MACLNSYTDDLTCSICLSWFDDPVSLPCGHSFCRKCVKNKCPQCNETVPTDLPTTNHILKSLVERAKDAATMKIGHEKLQECLCPEHEEKLKLFCETDQQLACVICRDGEKHEGHKFKPIKEAAVSLRRELEKGVEILCSDVLAIERQAQEQRQEITTTTEKSSHLMTQINAQFEEMYQFLTKRKGEIKKELKEKEREAVEKMSEGLNTMETALSECKGIEARARSCLEITDPEKFLRSWTEGTSSTTMPESLFKSRAMEFWVTPLNQSLSLGPYESHLQFFVWKELLQMVKPLPERLALKRDNAALKLSLNGRSLFWSVQYGQLQNKAFGGADQSGGLFDFFGRQPGAFGGASQPGAFGGASQPGAFGGASQSGAFGGASQSGAFGGASQSGAFGGASQSGAFGVASQSGAFGGASQSGAFGGASQSGAFGGASQSGAFGGASQSGAFGGASQSGAFGGARQSGAFGGASQSGAFGGASQPGAFDFDQPRTSDTKTFSANEFSEGQHYWEIEVGDRAFWELGVDGHFLRYNGQRYSICHGNVERELAFTGIRQKIGVYLNCSSKHVCFYDAANMEHVDTTASTLMPMPLSAYFNLGNNDGRQEDHNPLTVCWY